MHPFCGEHPAEKALGGAFAEAEASAEMEREDSGQVHEVGHVVNLQTERFEGLSKFAGVHRGTHAVREHLGMSECSRWEESTNGDQWIRWIVEGEEEVPARGEDPHEFAKPELEFSPGFEVVERRDGDDPIEGLIRKRERAGIGDARLQGGMPE